MRSFRHRFGNAGFHLFTVDTLRNNRPPPTFGFVPRTGAMALSWTMDKLGPICRAVEDCAIVMQSIYGPDARTSLPARPPSTGTPTSTGNPCASATSKMSSKPISPEHARGQTNRAGHRRRKEKSTKNIVGKKLPITAVAHMTGSTISPHSTNCTLWA